MSKYLYDYKLTIGLPANTVKELAIGPSFESKGIPFKKQVDFEKYAEAEEQAQRNAFLITGLQISFSITKDDSTEANSSSIEVFNLSDKTVNYINSNIKNNLICKLEAGYKGDPLKLLFLGRVESMRDVFESETRQTTINLTDGTSNTTEAHSSKSYPKGTSHNVIVNDLINDLGLPKGTVVNFAEFNKLASSRAMSGNTHNLIKNLSEMNGSDYHIQDGKVNIIPTNKRLGQQSAYISPDSGLIGSPEPLEKQKGKSKQSDVITDGIRFKCLLDGGLTVGTTVWVKSRNYDSAFKISKVTHNGDYEGNNWVSEVEAIKVDAVIVG